MLNIPFLRGTVKTPDDGHRNCPKHVEFYSKNKFEKLVHLVDFIVGIHKIHQFLSQQYFILQWKRILYNTGNLIYIYIYIVRPYMLISLFAQEKRLHLKQAWKKKNKRWHVLSTGLSQPRPWANFVHRFCPAWTATQKNGFHDPRNADKGRRVGNDFVVS